MQANLHTPSSRLKNDLFKIVKLNVKKRLGGTNLISKIQKLKALTQTYLVESGAHC